MVVMRGNLGVYWRSGGPRQMQVIRLTHPSSSELLQCTDFLAATLLSKQCTACLINSDFTDHFCDILRLCLRVRLTALRGLHPCVRRGCCCRRGFGLAVCATSAACAKRGLCACISLGATSIIGQVHRYPATCLHEPPPHAASLIGSRDEH